MIKHIPKKYRKIPKDVVKKKKYKSTTTASLSKFESLDKVDTYRKSKGRTLEKPSKTNYIFSKGEARIKEVLIQNKIPFVCEKIFKDCVNPKTNCALRFDFYLKRYSLCIEYDGKHYAFKMDDVSKEEFEQQKYRDSIKDKYCIDNGIKLIRIPSRKFSQIETILKEALVIKNSDAN